MIVKRSRVPREILLEKAGSIYKLAILASRRAQELSEGSPKLVEVSSKTKPGLIALEEIAEGKVRIKDKGKKPSRPRA